MVSEPERRESTDALAVRASSRWRALARARRVVGPVAVAACAAFLLTSLYRSWSTVEESIAHADFALLAASFGAAVFAMTAMAAVWADVLAAIGASVRRVQVVAWYFAGEAGKYVPGGIWSVVGRGELAARGVGRSVAYQSVVLSLLLLYGAAAVVIGVTSLPFGQGAALGGRAWALLVVPVAIVALHPRTAAAAERLVQRVSGRRFELALPPWHVNLRLAASYLPAWALVCATTLLVTQALGYEASVVTTCYAALVSWLVGFVFVPAPGGIGVREACFVALSDLGHGEATAVALLARVCFVGADAAGAGLAAWWLRRDRLTRKVGSTRAL